MNALTRTLNLKLSARIASFALSAFLTAGMLGGVNALAVSDAPAQMASAAHASHV